MIQIDLEPGTLEINDSALTVTGVSNEVRIPLDPMPTYKFTRGLGEHGALVFDDATIPLRNEHAATVITELRRIENERGSSAKKGKGRIDI